MKSPGRKSSDIAKGVRGLRKKMSEAKLTFGVEFLDDATGGIQTNDLIVIGAGTGSGKTDFVSNLAYKNAKLGKKVYGIYLEASETEIEARQIYKLLAKEGVKRRMNPSYRKWLNMEQEDLDKLPIDTKHFDNVINKYRDKSYTVEDVEKDLLAAEACDLIVIDHLHYFDIEDENENRAVTKIVKKISDIAQVIQKPVVLVSHLRKRDKQYSDLVPSLDEFHGSSNIVKIATKVVTIGVIETAEANRVLTGMRIPKCRLDGSVTGFTAWMFYDVSLGDYQPGYSLGKLSRDGKTLEEIERKKLPDWYRGRDKQGST